MAAAPELLLPRVSRVLPALLLTLHGLGATAWWYAGLSGWMYWAALGGLFVSLGHALLAARRPPAARLDLLGGGGVRLVDGFGEIHELRMGAGSRDLGMAIWLQLQPVGEGAEGRRLLLLRDALPGRDWYRLKRWMRFPPP